MAEEKKEVKAKDITGFRFKEQEENDFLLEVLNDNVKEIVELTQLISLQEMQSFYNLINILLGQFAKSVMTRKLEKSDYDYKRGYYNGGLFARDLMANLTTIFATIENQKK